MRLEEERTMGGYCGGGEVSREAEPLRSVHPWSRNVLGMLISWSGGSMLVTLITAIASAESGGAWVFLSVSGMSAIVLVLAVKAIELLPSYDSETGLFKSTAAVVGFVSSCIGIGTVIGVGVLWLTGSWMAAAVPVVVGSMTASWARSVSKGKLAVSCETT